jgi:hypothetical protein
MIPQPPSPSDGSAIPPRQRPKLGNFAKETTESDLWAFDDAEPASGDAVVTHQKSTQHLLPIPRESDKTQMRPRKDTAGTKFGGNGERIKVPVNKPLPVVSMGYLAEPSNPGSDFDDLDTWDEPVVAPAPLILQSSGVEAPPPARQDARLGEIVPQPSSRVNAPDEFPPPVRETPTPVSWKTRLHLSSLERIGIGALLVLLCLAGTVVYFFTIHRLPSRPEFTNANEFPIHGKHLAILSASSHWRAPKPTDTARRGTQLLPVLNLKSSGGPAAVRVFFRNSEGELVGDAVTRLIQTDGDLEVVATAGFDDVGMHAAYRNGLSKSWTIEIFEAPSQNSAGMEFKKLFIMDISTDRR